MKIFLASDHAGFYLKEKVKTYLRDKGYEIEDCGAYELNIDDDYPDFIGKASEGVSRNPESRGIVFGGSGQAEAMVANKFPNVRCALFYTPSVPVLPADITGRISTDPFEMIRLTREHNDANMLSLGARFLKEEDVFRIVDMWIETPFSNDARHVRRLNKIKQIENGK